jgi:hypothetical protein
MARFAVSLFAASLAVSILGARADTAFTQTAPRPPLPVIRHGKLAAKQEHAAKRNIERVPRKKGYIGRVLRKGKSGLSVGSRPRSLFPMQTDEPTSKNVCPIPRRSGRCGRRAQTCPEPCFPCVSVAMIPGQSRRQRRKATASFAPLSPCVRGSPIFLGNLLCFFARHGSPSKLSFRISGCGANDAGTLSRSLGDETAGCKGYMRP